MTGSAAQRRIALIIEYDGAGFAGSQRQTNGPSIQQELEVALERLTSAPVRIALAGRTDAGVHAIGQVAAFSTESRQQTGVLLRGLNSLLPEQVAVRSVHDVGLGFDPRRDAWSRTYRYTIYNAPERSPLWRDRAWHVPRPLDADRMSMAGKALIGEHDFAAFSRREPTTTVRRVLDCRVQRHRDHVVIEMTANAFLRHQVRRTAGALAQVGLGKLSVASFRKLLSSAEPNSAGPVAPALGLVLVQVAYPDLDLGEATRYDTCLTGLEGPRLIVKSKA